MTNLAGKLHKVLENEETKKTLLDYDSESESNSEESDFSLLCSKRPESEKTELFGNWKLFEEEKLIKLKDPDIYEKTKNMSQSLPCVS